MVIPSSHLRRLKTYSSSAAAIHNYFVFFEISSQFTSKIKTFHDNVHKHLFLFLFFNQKTNSAWVPIFFAKFGRMISIFTIKIYNGCKIQFYLQDFTTIKDI